MKLIVNSDYENLKAFFEKLPDHTFDFEGLMLHDGRNRVKAFSAGGNKIVVKRFKKPNFINQVIYTYIRGSKAERAYENAHRLSALEVDTPTPMACINIYHKGLVTYSYLITEYTDYQPITNIFSEDTIYHAPLFESFVKFTVDLHKKGINHKDYNLTNVLYHQTGENEYVFTLIDINRMEFGRMSRKKCFDSIKRMCTNSEITFYLSSQYAELRGWDAYRSIIHLSIVRALFEKKRKRKKRIKQWAKELVEV